MLKELIEKIKKYNPNGNLELVEKAYHFAEKAHEGQFRKSGESYFIHPYQVALILTDYSMDEETICGGLLHDVVEDTTATYSEIEELFGTEVAELVDGVTKLKKLKYKSEQESQAESLRKMLIAMAKDIRVIIIKLADRLHNTRTLNFMTEEKQKEKSMETLQIYAPIAHRLGMSKMKIELEDTSIMYIDPDGYNDLVNKVNKMNMERGQLIEDVMEELNEKLDEADIEHEMTGRSKHYYSIYRKMYYQNKAFEQIFDLTALRVLVGSVRDCYAVLGIIHTLWKPIPGRFKDYIAMPKSNMYQSLHTTVIKPGAEPFEIQIRTYGMHKIAEFGIAAHWKYKASENSQETNAEELDFEKKLSWIKQMMEWQHELKDPQEFMETIKIDFYSEDVFVFTPEGDVVDLPVGSTPIDFAYKIHSDVGNTCTGSKIDGRMVPLDTKLKNGNIVEIITSKNGTPSRDWLKIAVSNQAKQKIRNWFKKEDREENLIKGRENLEKEIRRQKYKDTELLKEEWLESLTKKTGYPDLEGLYAAIGSGAVSTTHVINLLKEKYKEHHKDDIQEVVDEREVERKPVSPRADQGVVIKGIDNIKAKLARCCSPVPGDEIVGYITRGRGVSVHRKDCKNIENETEHERLIDVEWAGTEETKYIAEIQVKAEDRVGLLTEITLIIAEFKLSVRTLNARTLNDNIILINIGLAIKDVEQLGKLSKKIKKINGVMDVYRMKT